MGYNQDKWQRRIKKRSDISGFVYHLTKAELDKDGNVVVGALDRLLKILKERTLNGSTTESGFIIGNRKAICFQDAPISGIVQNVIHEREFKDDLGGKDRYTHFGLAFPKSYLYKCGARPVIYEQKDVAKKMLPPEEYWRIVDFNLANPENIVDWTHEREWRLPADKFIFEIDRATVLLPNQHMYKKLLENLPEDDLKSLFGIIQSSPIAY